MKAGKYGAKGHNCDTPIELFQETLEYIRDYIKPDIVFWSGDNVAHDDIYVTEDETVATMKATSQLVGDILAPSVKSIIPALGNHDLYIPNNFGEEEGRASVLATSEIFKYWLDEDAIESYKKYGYYKQELKLDSDRKVMAFSINSISCYELNH